MPGESWGGSAEDRHTEGLTPSTLPGAQLSSTYTSLVALEDSTSTSSVLTICSAWDVLALTVHVARISPSITWAL